MHDQEPSLDIGCLSACQLAPAHARRHREDARCFLATQGINMDAVAPQLAGKFFSAFIRATKLQA